jgi:hypothetical protein
MPAPSNEQKSHDLAVAFAAAEYNNELKRRNIDMQNEKPQKGIDVFVFLYKQALQDFKRSSSYFSGD